MASPYPDALDTTSSLPNRSSGDLIPASDNNDKNAALIALEKKVGIGVSEAAFATTGQVPKKQANGTTAWSSLSKADVGLSNVQNTDTTNRANHTGTQLASTISDLSEVIEDTIGTKLKAGANTSISYNDATGETTIASTGGDGSGAVDSVNGQTGIVSLDQDDIADGSIAKQFTAPEKSKLAAIATGADVTSAATIAAAIDGASTKSTPIDADTIGLIDSAASNALKKLSWSNVKTTLKTYFDTLYAAATHTHAESDITNLVTDLAAKVPTTRTVNTKALSSNVTLTQDDIGDGTTAKQFSASEKTKLAAVEAGAQVNTVTAASATTFTNKIFDANGTGNAISNLEVADFASGVIDPSTTLASNSDAKIPTQRAVKAAIAAAGGGSGTPGGSTTQIQYNNAGAFAGNADLTWDNTTNAKALTVKGKVNGGDFLIGADSYTPTVVYVGDSLTYGVNEADYPYNHYITLPTWNGFPFEETNIGVGGLTVYQMKARMAQYHNVLYHQKSPLNISVILGGVNDLAIANGAHSPQELYSVMAEFCKHAKQLGWRVVVMTMISGDNGPENFDTSKNIYNGLLCSTWTDFADLLIDLAAEPNLGADGAYANATYFHDGVHLTNTGYALVGSIVEEALTGYISQASTIAAHKKGSVVHADDADYPRPIGYATVEWIGSVSPNNAAEYDTWLGPASI